MATAAVDDEAEPFTLTVPVSKERPAEGTVTFESRIPDITKFAGFFSFTLYTGSNNIDKFKETPYYYGLKIYIQLIHSQRFYDNVGIIIYTTWVAQEMLDELFPEYPKLIFAIVDCPRFVVNEKFNYNGALKSAQMLDKSIFRCMRFHAVEAFPTAWICVRDADTYFRNEIMTAVKAYESGYKLKSADGSSRVFTDPSPVLADKIGEWEQLFITKWLERGSPITLGVNVGYLADWHTEFPIVYPIKNARNTGDRFADSALYMQAPYGILAGFCSFARSRPADIWHRMYDYLATHYPVVSVAEKKYQLSNRSSEIPDSFIHYIGKDERILLFALMPVYLAQCYFFYIFFDNLERFGMCKIYNNTRPFTCEALFNFSHPPVRTDTIMLSTAQPPYIYTVYWRDYTLDEFHNLPILPYDKLSEYRIRFDKRARDIIRNNYKIAALKLKSVRFTFHDYFAAIFEEFYSRFNPWYASLMKESAASIQDRIRATNGVPPALTAANFYEPARRIMPMSIVKARDPIWKLFEGGGHGHRQSRRRRSCKRTTKKRFFTASMRLPSSSP